MACSSVLVAVVNEERAVDGLPSGLALKSDVYGTNSHLLTLLPVVDERLHMLFGLPLGFVVLNGVGVWNGKNVLVGRSQIAVERRFSLHCSCLVL